MENLERLHGKRFTAKIENVSVEGKISIENNHVYLCQNNFNGWDCEDKLGYKYSWMLKNFDSPEINDVTELKIISMTKEEIENYKDFKEGDEIIDMADGEIRKVNVVLNNICFL